MIIIIIINELSGCCMVCSCTPATTRPVGLGDPPHLPAPGKGSDNNGAEPSLPHPYHTLQHQSHTKPLSTVLYSLIPRSIKLWFAFPYHFSPYHAVTIHWVDNSDTSDIYHYSPQTTFWTESFSTHKIQKSQQNLHLFSPKCTNFTLQWTAYIKMYNFVH